MGRSGADTVANGLTVDLQVSVPAPALPRADTIRQWVLLAAESAGQALGPHAELCVRIVDADESRQLNGDYRGRDRPTNVLAFPAGLDGLPGLPDGEAGLLGDLVLCADVVAREADEQGKQEADHWAHLLVHGTLHLLGFDHQNSDEADIMEALERRILEGQGLKNPYENG